MPRDEVTQSKQKTTNTLRLLLRPSLSFPISQSLSPSRTLALRVSIQLSLIRISHADAQPLFHVAKQPPCTAGGGPTELASKVELIFVPFIGGGDKRKVYSRKVNVLEMEREIRPVG